MNSDYTKFIKYWEEKGARKDFSTPFQIELFNSHVDKSAEILDVGCGYGRIMSLLHKSGFENIKGVEPSDSLRKRGREYDSSLDLRELKDNQISFTDNSFDAALLVAVLTCIPKDEDQTALINEIYRVLRPDGVLYINDFLLNSDERNLKRYAEFEAKYSTFGVFELEGGGVLRHFSPEHIEMLLTNFQTVEYKEVIYTTMNGNKSMGFYYIGRK
ncbi:class I SAM-dependent methyltransferase [Maridesulfovibrio zosterae]|uniref:class I SAM-dependent methyltransferase n=1 Tax=Maridesulfovibrio zosterae TaxID=82171 RepID=UPI000429D4A5|nr:class I SAM-dependent methyltransferase [Maridesulfovibrio zosterae]